MAQQVFANEIKNRISEYISSIYENMLDQLDFGKLGQTIDDMVQSVIEIQSDKTGFSDDLEMINVKIQQYGSDKQDLVDQFQKQSLPDKAEVQRQVLSEIKNMDPVDINLPVQGIVTLTIEDFENRLKRSKISLESFVESELESLDQEQILHRVRNSFNERMKCLSDKATNSFAEIIPGIIERMNKMSFSANNPAVNRFINGLDETFQIFVDIQVDMPSQEMDELYAELISLTDTPVHRDRLMEIGEKLGFDRDEMEDMDIEDLSETLLDYF